MKKHLAAIDLGSNSFHLQVGRVEGEQIFYLDAYKESVRLAGGLTAQGGLDAASQRRALECLARMGERLRGMALETVRAVGTNTLRVARNADAFLAKAQAALGFPIEVVAGREEARLIYLGVAHSLAYSDAPRLVVDIGGGSTECIIGRGYEPLERESTRMGCVVYSQRFFADGALTKTAFKAAITAAEAELAPVAAQFQRGRWQQAIGSSGTARALGEILRQNGQSDGAITREGLKELRARCVALGSLGALELPGLKEDRRPVIVGGLAVMSALFEAFAIERMEVAQGAMREGILWDLLGRGHRADMRDVTVHQFMQRYHADLAQAARVERTALRLLADSEGLGKGRVPLTAERHLLMWAARLHEIGLSIAHSGQHKHAAYILANADMPGFSRQDQQALARVVRCSRGGIDKAQNVLALDAHDPLWRPILALRLAVLLHQNRTGRGGGEAILNCKNGACVLQVQRDLSSRPYTRAALAGELADWQQVQADWRLHRISYTNPNP